jgi:hypothetical protein
MNILYLGGAMVKWPKMKFPLITMKIRDLIEHGNDKMGKNFQPKKFTGTPLSDAFSDENIHFTTEPYSS